MNRTLYCTAILPREKKFNMIIQCVPTTSGVIYNKKIVACNIMRSTSASEIKRRSYKQEAVDGKGEQLS